jgi:hypothetical protein
MYNGVKLRSLKSLDVLLSEAVTNIEKTSWDNEHQNTSSERNEPIVPNNEKQSLTFKLFRSKFISINYR